MTLDTLTTNWNEYDSHKVRLQADARTFDYHAAWEVSYFSDRLKSVYPFIPETIIKTSIQQCTRQLPAPCTREVFVEQVLRRLSIPL